MLSPPRQPTFEVGFNAVAQTPKAAPMLVRQRSKNLGLCIHGYFYEILGFLRIVTRIFAGLLRLTTEEDLTFIRRIFFPAITPGNPVLSKSDERRNVMPILRSGIDKYLSTPEVCAKD